MRQLKCFKLREKSVEGKQETEKLSIIDRMQEKKFLKIRKYLNICGTTRLMQLGFDETVNRMAR